MSAKHVAKLTGAFLALLSLVVAASAPAEAGDQWRWRNHSRPNHVRIWPQERYIRVPRLDILLGEDARDIAVYDDDSNDFYDAEMNRPSARRRAAMQGDLWWLEDDSVAAEADDLVPVYKKTPKRIVKSAAKPVVKVSSKQTGSASTPVVKNTSTSTPKTVTPARAARTSSVAVVSPVTKSSMSNVSAKSNSEIQTASLGKPAQDAIARKPSSATGKTIGCTAGAAIVTGYGYGSVKPRACTGSTYSYEALRDGKSYVISMLAASGEITDVKKLQ